MVGLGEDEEKEKEREKRRQTKRIQKFAVGEVIGKDRFN